MHVSNSVPFLKLHTFGLISYCIRTIAFPLLWPSVLVSFLPPTVQNPFTPKESHPLGWMASPECMVNNCSLKSVFSCIRFILRPWCDKLLSGISITPLFYSCSSRHLFNLLVRLLWLLAKDISYPHMCSQVISQNLRDAFRARERGLRLAQNWGRNTRLHHNYLEEQERKNGIKTWWR